MTAGTKKKSHRSGIKSPGYLSVSALGKSLPLSEPCVPRVSWRNELDQQSTKISTKGQRAHILGFAGHTVSVAATQLCHSGVKVPIDSEWAGCVPVKLYLPKTGTGLDLLQGCSLLTPGLGDL